MSDADAVFSALADRTRRELLDRLYAANGQTLAELCTSIDMTRQAVSKHLTVLERAGLVVTLRRGREKLHYLNPAPIAELATRWIGKYERARVAALAELKQQLEEEPNERACERINVTALPRSVDRAQRGRAMSELASESMSQRFRAAPSERSEGVR